MACPVPLSSFRSVSLSSVARTSLMMKEERAERHRAQGIGIIILLLFPCQSVGLDRSRFHCLSSHLPRVTVSSSGVSVASGGTVMTRKGDHIINSLSIPTPVPPPKGWWSSWSYKSESFSVSILSLWSHLIVLTSWIERSMWWTIIPCHWALGTSSDSSSHPQFIESFFLAYIIIRGLSFSINFW